MKQPAIVILHGNDNVAVALDALAPDVPIDVHGAPLRPADAIPAGHKVATAPIARGDAIVKCGQPIGVALRDIAAGEHVHVHNVGMPDRHANDDGPVGDAYEVETDRRDTFDGFVRPDGSDVVFGGAGTRAGRNDDTVLATGDLTHNRDADTIVGDNGRITRPTVPFTHTENV